MAVFSMRATGVLAQVPGSPFDTGGPTASFGCSIVVNATGKYVYVEDINNVYAFAVDGASGALTLVNTVSGPRPGGGLAVDPAGAFLCVVGSGSNSIESFAINPTTGALSPSSSSPLVLQDGAYTISIDPSGQFAYTVESSATLVAYSVHRGVLTSLNGSYPGALGSQQLAIDPTDSFIYSLQTGTVNDVSGFRIGASGTLSALPGSPTPAGQWPLSITIISE